jgi:hypothetical protein
MPTNSACCLFPSSLAGNLCGVCKPSSKSGEHRALMRPFTCWECFADWQVCICFFGGLLRAPDRHDTTHRRMH